MTRASLGMACWLLFSVAGLAACPATPMPETGLWTYASRSTVANTCNFEGVIADAGDQFVIASDLESELQWVPIDGVRPFACSADFDGLTCERDPHRVLAETFGGLDVELTTEITIVAQGDDTFFDHMIGEQRGIMECDGSECDALAEQLHTSFPCTFVVGFDAVLTE